MPQIILEGREFNAKPLSPADRCRYARQIERLKRSIDLHAVELLMIMSGIVGGPTVTFENADAITKSLAPLMAVPKEEVLTGQAAVDKLRAMADG